MDPNFFMEDVLVIASRRLGAAALATAALTLAACGGGGNGGPGPAGGDAASPATPAASVSVDKNAYPVFPNADAGADPAVPAEQGGKGFKG
jgi:hypothetical protein